MRIMGEANQFLLFRVADWRFGVPLTLVERVVRAVAITPFPRGSGSIVGVIDVHGSVLPVHNLRKRFGAPEREIDPDDCFVLVCNGDQRLALIAEAVEGVVAAEETDIVQAGQGTFTAVSGLDGVLRLPDGLGFVTPLTKPPAKSGQAGDVSRGRGSGINTAAP